MGNLAKVRWGIVIILAIAVAIIVVVPIYIFLTSSNSTPLSDQKIEIPAEDTFKFDDNGITIEVPPDRAGERITKKPFGIKVSPEDSPVNPERFSGYHTGVDFEIFVDEVETDVPVLTICDGTLRLKRESTGYGGVAIQDCFIDDQPVTVLYGHLKLSSIKASVGDYLQTTTTIGVLGAGETQETDGERKHLHLAIHKGTTINLRGYVVSANELTQWLDPSKYLISSGALQ